MLKIIDVPQVGEDASVDGLGRITIPKPLRIKFGIISGGQVEIIPTKEGIFIKNNKCEIENKFIDFEIEDIIKKYVNELKKESIDWKRGGKNG